MWPSSYGVDAELLLILLATQTYLQGRSTSRSRKIASLKSRPESEVPSIIQERHNLALGCAVYRVNVLHGRTAKPQVVYRAVDVDWKLQNNCEKRSFSGTKAS